MFLIYNFIIIVFILGYLPVFFVKLGQADNKKRLLLDRFAFYSKDVLKRLHGRSVIWLHAVSVGEVLALKDFLDCLREYLPEYKIVISTVTPTGNRIAKRIAQEKAEVIYLPIDISFITNRAILSIAPKLLVLMETELWPNLILSAVKNKVKVAVVNGRISPKSFKNYYKFKFLISNVLSKVDLFLMQNIRYAKRLEHLGVVPEKTVVTGNMKFDNLDLDELDLNEVVDVKKSLGFNSDDFLLLAASTHCGEEKVVLEALKKLREKYPKLKVLLVPRHIERVNEIVDTINAEGLSFNVADKSALSENFKDSSKELNYDVYVLNTIGQLKKMYQLADVVFMGGSLIKHGGQNPLEAIAVKKPIVSGVNVFNFPGIYENLFKLEAVLEVGDISSFINTIDRILKDKEFADNMVEKAYAWLDGQAGASKTNVKKLKELLN